jgi:imidazolonepropionase
MDEPRQLWWNARIASGSATAPAIERGAIVTHGTVIEWLGEEAALPAELRGRCAARQDLGGAWVTPGLIDCHTHLVFAGNRAAEYGARLRGATYEEISRAGGGILATVRATRAASEEELLAQSVPRLQSLLAEGVTTVEIKSGYGLTLESERRMLRVARELGRRFPVTVKCTFLGAHALPPEYAGRPDEYVAVLASEWLPALVREGLVDAVDVFCERIGFTVQHARELFEAARALGLPVKMHAGQLSNLGGTRLAAVNRALSCDHLEYTSNEDLAAMRASGTVAVLLPIAWYCLADPQRPAVARMREVGVDMAVATDCNPGSAPSASLLLALSMATRLFGLTPAEALAGATRIAAQALGLAAERGTLEIGRDADFAVWAVDSVDELGYWAGFNPCRAVVRGGQLVRGDLSFPHENFRGRNTATSCTKSTIA